MVDDSQDKWYSLRQQRQRRMCWIPIVREAYGVGVDKLIYGPFEGT